MLTAILVAIGYVCGSMPWGYWLVRIFRGRGHPHAGERQHRRDERLARARAQARTGRRLPRHREGVRACARRDEARRPRRRRARGRCGDARSLPPALPRSARREDRRDDGRRVPRRRADRRRVRRGRVAPRLRPDALRIGGVDHLGDVAPALGVARRLPVARDRLRRSRCGGGPRAASREHPPPHPREEPRFTRKTRPALD